MNSYIEMMKTEGFRVFIRKEKSEYCYCTDGTSICYVQWSDGRPQVSTVHYPNKHTGTGFQFADRITPATLRDTMKTIAPSWARSGDFESVRKYKNWNDFHKSNSFNSELKEVRSVNPLIYSNPRMSATIENWPSGSKRVTARFEIEQDAKRGERATRTTTGAPKKLTYARLARIVDGSDGRTYIAEFTMYGHISIMRGDMKFTQETLFERDPRYSMALELFA